MSKLYVIGTPIGNLEDISLRALRILKEVDLILCEDTRVTKKILFHYNINASTLSYHSNSKLSKVEKIIELLKEDNNLALVSDAGTPLISDPGSKLISEIREKLPEIEIVSIPGPSALTAFISIAGIQSNEFVFLGFLPHKKGRETKFKEILESKKTVIFYESPHRLMKTLSSLSKYMGNKRVVVGKELTKIHEEIISGTADEVLDYFRENQDKIRGEFVVSVSRV